MPKIFFAAVLIALIITLASAQSNNNNNDKNGSNNEPLRETITVTPARIALPISETGSNIVLLGQQQLEKSPSRTLDDLLRYIPGFSLLRRTSSLVANPTTQGVSLRGLGSNGASRTLVLLDGIPINDPFGGWVYWARIPRASIDRVEVLTGSRSDLYGSTAISGVIQVFTRPITGRVFTLDLVGGNLNTGSLSFFGADKINRFGLALAGELFTTDGYRVISAAERGRVDTAADSRHATLDLRLNYDLTARFQASLRANSFSEDRANGTPLQQNHSEIRLFAASLRGETVGGSNIGAQIYGTVEQFTSTFSAIAANRASESLTRSQRVPIDAIGFSTQWSHALPAQQTLLIGVDGRYLRATNDELIFIANQPSGRSITGGRQFEIGLFLQDSIALRNNLRLSFGAQFDHNSNRDRANLISRDQNQFNPRLAIQYRPADIIGLRASVYRAFRTPTLNELYRSFRVGNVLTLANSALSAETLIGGEAGFDLTPTRQLRLSLTGFGAELERPIANVTVTVAPDLITRQRQNLGALRSAGVELRLEYSINSALLFTAGYLYTQSTVQSFSANRALVGLNVAQVPRHQTAATISYSRRTLGTLSVQARASSGQFEDDQNRLRLGGYGLIDLGYRRALWSHLALFINVENLFDRRISTGRTPPETIGSPRLVSGGLHINFGH